jgi:hypothetical protein
MKYLRKRSGHALTLQILFIMMLYLNMTAKATLGGVILKNVSQFEVSESIMEMSNTAKITIPRGYKLKNQEGWSILDFISVGDKVTIDAGYYRNDLTDVGREFTGYIREIESDIPLVIHCDDETYPLRQNNLVKSYQDKATKLKQVLADIVPKTMAFECPDVNVGRFHIDNESSFQVLQRIKNDYGLYSSLQNGILRVHLRDIVKGSDIKQVHTYVLNPITSAGSLVKKNELKFKRKEDYKLHVKVTSVLPSGKKITVDVGNKDKGASLIQFTYPGQYTEKQLRAIATGIYNNRCYDGYSGTITGFGLPRTHAGDALVIEDKVELDRNGKYLIEKVEITYNESSGFTRKNTLSYRIG